MRISRLGFLLIALTSACSMPPPYPAGFDVSHAPKINLDVQDIGYVDRTSDNPPLAPRVDTQFNPSLTEAARQWASARMQAVGVSGHAVVIVRNAYVTEQKIPTETSWFNRPQGSKYIGHIEIEIDAQGRQGTATASAAAERNVSLPENPNADEKYRAYRTLLEGLMQDLDRYMDDAVRLHLADFLVTAPIVTAPTAPMLQPVSPAMPVH